jgi:teichuronic acid biosynthesis protein TuaE
VSAGSIVAVALGAGLIVATAWVCWRRPTVLLALALASLAVRPQLFFGGPAVGYAWGLHHTLLLLGLIVSALRYGIRRSMNWPLAALIAAFALSLAAGDLHPKLSLPFMGMSLAIFALPWCFTSVLLEPGSRRALALVIALTPLLSVAVGAVMALAGIRAGFPQLERMQGATGNAAAFAILAFAGFAVALHEASRPGRPFADLLAAVNLGLVILSGTRMAIAASGVFLVAYLALSESLRQRLRTQRVRTAAAGAIVVAALLWYWPALESRLFEHAEELGTILSGDADPNVNLSGRDDLWKFYLKEFTFSPLFGRGIGAGFVAGADWIAWPRTTPHNEYLHLLVNTGAVGFALLAAAIFFWYRSLLQLASDNDRPFLFALIPAMGVFAITEDVLGFSTGLAVFAYLGVLLTKRATRPLPPRVAKAGRRVRSAAGAEAG